MINFGFWNVDSSGDWQKTRQNIPQYAADLASEHSLDLLFLIECAIPVTSLMTAFTSAQNHFSIPSAERFKVVAWFDPRFMVRMQLPVPNDRVDIWHLTLPLQEEVLVALVHGPDKRNYDVTDQELFLQQVVADLSYCEQRVEHTRSIVLGDFNASPFESPVASTAGMNAVSSRRIAQGAPRRILNKSFAYFYNPMWNLFGDARGNGVPATYYYRKSYLYWHMLDQVLIRPSLIERFDFTALQVVTELKNAQLIGADGVLIARQSLTTFL